MNTANQMTSSGGISYVYDGYNRRVKKVNGSNVQYSLYNQSGQFLSTTGTKGPTEHIYLGSQLVARVSQVATTDDKPGYTGHLEDKDIGLTYMQQRYYDPVIGRFYSNDPIGFRDTHSFNRYAYANNNPYKYVDPFGMASEKPNVMETEAARRRESCFKDPNCSHHEFQRAELERPDSDKDLTYDEANEWYNNGGGEPLYVPLESISINKISSTQFKGVGTSRYFNLFNPLHGATFEDASIYGSITLTLINDNTVKATFGFDNYNFDLKPWNGFENHLRNYLTVIGRDRTGPGEPFKIYLYGVAEINK